MSWRQPEMQSWIVYSVDSQNKSQSVFTWRKVNIITWRHIRSLISWLTVCQWRSSFPVAILKDQSKEFIWAGGYQVSDNKWKTEFSTHNSSLIINLTVDGDIPSIKLYFRILINAERPISTLGETKFGEHDKVLRTIVERKI